MQDLEKSRIYNEMDRMSDDELERERYWIAVRARTKSYEVSIEIMRMVDALLLRRHTTLCECCLGRTGCDMCSPPEPWDRYASDEDWHYEQFGRPSFPNEY